MGRDRLALRSALFRIGLGIWLVGVPALLGLLAGAQLERRYALQAPPFRALFALLGALGGLWAWRQLTRTRRARR